MPAGGFGGLLEDGAGIGGADLDGIDADAGVDCCFDRGGVIIFQLGFSGDDDDPLRVAVEGFVHWAG